LLYYIAQRSNKPWGAWRYSASDILAAYFWAVVHDRPILWATCPKHWPDSLLPAKLSSEDRMSRRLAKWESVRMMREVEDYLVAIITVGCVWLSIIDAKLLTISAISSDPAAGYGHGAGRREKGYKLLAIYGAGPMPVAGALGPVNSSEKSLARALIPGLTGAR